MIIKKSSIKTKQRSPWFWIPTLYFGEALPYSIVVFLSVIMYKRLGVENSEIAFYTGWLFIPWIIKPLWSPLVDILKTKRKWITFLQIGIALSLGGIALTIPAPDFFQLTLMFFWVLAFVAATHETAADGFYILALNDSNQSFFIGFKNALHKFALITGQSLIVIFAGFLESNFSIAPTEINIQINPNKLTRHSVLLDTSSIKTFEGKLKIVASPNVLEIGSTPITKETANFYLNFAHEFNIMNGLDIDEIFEPDTTSPNESVGNIGIVKLHLSKKPNDDDEYRVKLNHIGGSDGIKIIEGSELKFTSRNWNKPAYVVFQTVDEQSQFVEARFIAQSDKNSLAWTITFGILGVLFLIFFFYHRFVLPEPTTDQSVRAAHRSDPLNEFFRTFFRFFEKEKVVLVICFILLFNLGEGLHSRILPSFMLDPKKMGGLELTTIDVGLINGIIGISSLVLGGILGGIIISYTGLKKMKWWMIAAVNFPNIVFIYSSYFQPNSIFILGSFVAFEQFGYGFGFTFLLLYMIYYSQGEYRTSHYSITLSIMVLGIMLSGMFGGIIQEAFGYKYFFILVALSSIPSLILAKFIPLDSTFGKRKNDTSLVSK